MRPFLALVVSAVVWASVPQAQTLVHALLSPTPRSPGHFGNRVAGIGDLDGDGRGDLVVSAEWENNLVGRVHVFSGATGALLRTLASPTPSASPAGQFGLSLAAVPDVDGDAVPDIAVGASVEGSSATGFGRVHVFSGATGTLLRSLVSPNPEGGGQAFPSFGCAVAGVPDVDGDGRGDLLVGACREDASDAGRAYLISGASGALLRMLASPNPEANGAFGQRVSAVPDTDGDGTADLLVVALAEDGGATNVGRAYLFSGATGALRHTFVRPAAADGTFARDGLGVPDADGDGRGDVLFSAAGAVGVSGRIHVFSGATGALVRTLVEPSGSLAFVPTPLGVVPDINGDGAADYITGSSVEAGGGRVYVFSGATGALLALLTSPNPAQSGMFGIHVAGVPDATGDGRGDLLVGALQEAGTASSTGRAYLFSGALVVGSDRPPAAPQLALRTAPNPVRGTGQVRLTLGQPQRVCVALTDALGRRVAVLHDGPLAAGLHDWVLDVAGLAPGVYVVRATGATEQVARRVSVVGG